MFDIGCIECGKESAVVGLFDTEKEANAAKKIYITGETKNKQLTQHG